MKNLNQKQVEKIICLFKKAANESQRSVYKSLVDENRFKGESYCIFL